MSQLQLDNTLYHNTLLGIRKAPQKQFATLFSTVKEIKEGTPQKRGKQIYSHHRQNLQL